NEVSTQRPMPSTFQVLPSRMADAFLYRDIGVESDAQKASSCAPCMRVHVDISAWRLAPNSTGRTGTTFISTAASFQRAGDWLPPTEKFTRKITRAFRAKRLTNVFYKF